MINFQDLRLGDRLRELDVRRWLNDNTPVVTIAAVVLLMIALGIMLMTITGGGNGYTPPTQKYFYDLNTRELFAVPLDELPPIERGAPFALPSGQTMPAGVEAVVFGPEGGGEEDYVIGWVSTLRPETRQEIVEGLARARASSDPNEQAREYALLERADSERLVMDPKADPPRFVPAFSEQGFEITTIRGEDDQGRPMRPVYPR